MENEKTQKKPAAPRKPRVVKMKPQLKPRQLSAVVVPHSGHTLFEVNKVEMTIKPAEYEMVEKQVEVVSIMAKVFRSKATSEYVTKKVKEVIIKPDCLYISALNAKNVMKILVRNFGFVPEEPLKQ